MLNDEYNSLSGSVNLRALNLFYCSIFKIKVAFVIFNMRALVVFNRMVAVVVFSRRALILFSRRVIFDLKLFI